MNTHPTGQRLHMFRKTYFVAALVLSPLVAIAQETEQETAPTETGAAADPADDPESAGDRLVVREQTVYVPYRKLQSVFEQEGRGIFLPYEEFLELWRSAHPKPPTVKPVEPPAAAVIRSSPYVGSVDGELARFAVTYHVESLKDDWSELAVPLGNVAIESVDLGGSEAIFWASGDGYSLLLPKKGAYEVKLGFSVRVASAPGKKTLTFGIPPVAVSSVELTIPDESARVDVEPKNAATSVTQTDGKGTRLVAHVGNASRFSASWMPPVGQATEDAAVLIAKQYASATLSERILSLDSHVDYELARGEVAGFQVTVPTNDETRLLSVKGENIRRWNLDGETLQVELHSAVKDRYSLTLAFERNVADGATNVTVALPRMNGVLRETGWLALKHDPALRVTIDAQDGYSQLDPEEVPQPLRGDLRVGFQYLSPPPPLGLGVSKIEPVIRSRTVSVVTLGRERDDWVGFVEFTITKAGVFSISLRVPQRWSVEEIGDASTVDDNQSSEVADNLRTIAVNLKSRQLGMFRLPFKLTADGSAATGEKTVWPPIVVGTVQDQGIFGIAAPRALEIRTQGDGMSSVEPSELVQSGILSRVSTDAGDPQAYSYPKNSVAQRARLDLDLEEKQGEVEIVAQHLVAVDDSGRIRMKHFLDYEILYKARETLEFSAPSVLDGELRIDGEQVSETPQPEPQGNGLSKWIVNLQSAVDGHVPLTITHEITPEALDAGVAKTIDIPFVVPQAGVYKTRSGLVALTKSGNLEVQPQPIDLDVIEESRLTGKLRGGPILAAWEYTTKEPGLGLELTRYEAVPLARTVVSILHVKAVLSRKPCKLTAVATMILQNAGAQHLELQLPDSASMLSVHVAGQSVSTKQRKAGTSQLVVIPRSQNLGAFPVVAVYNQDLGTDMGSLGSRTLDMIKVIESESAPVPVQKVELDLHVPEGYRYLSWSGNLQPRGENETLSSKLGHVFSSAFGSSRVETPRTPPAGVASVDAQFDRTLEGTELHMFSTMARAGSVSLRYMTPSLFIFLQGSLFLLTAVGGLLLVRKIGWSELWVVVGLTAGPLVIAWFLETGTAGLFSAGFYGGLALGALVLIGRTAHCVGEWRQARETERLALAPDPFLEEAEPGAKPGSGAASESGEGSGAGSKPASDERPQPPADEATTPAAGKPQAKKPAAGKPRARKPRAKKPATRKAPGKRKES